MKKSLLFGLISAVFWLVLWEVGARLADIPFIFPTFSSSVAALARLSVTSAFWITIGASLLRILSGFAIGVVSGTVLGVLSAKSETVKILITPLMTVVKSTPVASFILLLWVVLGRATVPGAISALMVCPIVYQAVLSSFISLDNNLKEVLAIYRVPLGTRLKIFVIPSVFRSSVPALISASGFAWKSGIAAEIIAYTKNSIGGRICDAKSYFEGPEMYAWTLTVVILSLLIEYLIKTLSGKAVPHVPARQ